MVLDPDSTATRDVCLWLLQHKSLSPALAREVRRQYCNATPVPTTTRPTPRPPATGKADLADRLRDVFRQLAIKHHPDHGGSNAAMIVVNDVRERVRKALSLM